MTELGKFKVYRFLYANGYSAITDAEYDELRIKLEQEGNIFNPVYEEDPIPFQELYECGFTDEMIQQILKIDTSVDIAEYSYLLDGTDRHSIESVNRIGDAFVWCKANEGLEMVLTPKVDGVNTRRGFLKNNDRLELKIALTRASEGSAIPINITANYQKFLPFVNASDLPTEMDKLIVYSEAFVPEKYLNGLQSKYGIPLTVPRGGALSMLRRDIYSMEDYDVLRAPVFRVEHGDTIVEGLEFVKSLGFEIMPYWLYTYNGETYEEFREQISSLMDEIVRTAEDLDMKTDGVVIQVNDRHIFEKRDVKNNYSSGNLAFKFYHWEPGVYHSKVQRIIMEPRDAQYNCVAIVDPVIAKGGQRLTRVNLFNPDIMIRAGINKGSIISFKYKNETTSELIYKGDLQ